MLTASISKNGTLLFLFAIATAGILAVTYTNTKDTITAAERKARQAALHEIIPTDRIDNDLVADTLEIPEDALKMLGLSNEDNHQHTVSVAKKNGRIIAIIVPTTAPDGYSGDIKMLVGIKRDGSITGVRVLSHKETPGLGDKVDLKRSDWILSFNGKSLSNPYPAKWKVNKDGGEFDQFTGATITPRAIVKQVYQALKFVQNHRLLLFGEKSVDNLDTSEG